MDEVVSDAPAQPSAQPVGDARSAAGSGGGWRRRFDGAFIEVAVIVVAANFAVAQPLLDLLGRNAEFFIARDSQKIDLYLLALGLTVIGPLTVALGLVVLRALHRGTGTVVHAVVLAGTLAVLGLRIVKQFGEAPTALSVGLAGLFGVALTLAFRRSDGFRSYVRFLTPVPVLFLVLFLFFSSATKVLFPEGVASASGVTVGNPKPVVMIVFDEFALASLIDAEGNIDAEAFPNFARLAADSYWFRNTTPASDNTVVAVPATLDGNEADVDALPIASDHPNNLFTVLGGAYEVHAVEPVTQLCPTSICESTRVIPPLKSRMRSLASDLWIVYRHQVLPEGLKDDLPSIDQAWGGFATQGDVTGAGSGSAGSGSAGSGSAGSGSAGSGGAGSGGAGSGSDTNKFSRRAILDELGTDRLASFSAFIDGLPTDGRPTVSFAHMLLPHAPWQYLPDGAQYQGVTPFGLEGEVWDPDEWAALQSYQRLQVQVQFVDRKVGELIDKLQEAGTYDDTLIVLTADHGIGMIPDQPRRQIIPETFGGVGYVPLFVKAPGQDEGEIVDRPMSTVDIFPTVADILEVDLPVETDGRSGLASGADRDERVIQDRERGVVKYPLDQDALFEEVRRKEGYFGPPSDSEFRFYAAGPYRDLVGRAASEVEQGPDSGYDVTIDSRVFTNAVDRASGVLPAYLQGQIRRDGAAPEQPVPLAVAVNGTIAGVTQSFANIDGGVRFAVLVAPQTFQDGANRVEVFALDGDPADPRLLPVSDTAAGVDYSLEGDTIVSADGEWQIEDGSLTGWVSARPFDRRGLVVQGWAGDTTTGEPADEVLAFLDGDFVFAMPTGVERPDVAEETGFDTLLPSGFQGDYPQTFTEAAADGSLRLFARQGDRVTELNYAAGFPRD